MILHFQGGDLFKFVTANITGYKLLAINFQIDVLCQMLYLRAVRKQTMCFTFVQYTHTLNYNILYVPPMKSIIDDMVVVHPHF